MTPTSVEEIANAVLYEGYILYPYRRSSIKNKQRFNFGVLFPPAYCESAQNGETSWMQTECLVRGNLDLTFKVKVRYLHLVSQISGGTDFGFLARADTSAPSYNGLPGRESLHFEASEEALESDITLEVCLRDLQFEPRRQSCSFFEREQKEPILDGCCRTVGSIIRKQKMIRAEMEITARPLSEDIFKIRVTVWNRTPVPNDDRWSRERALEQSLVSAHAILRVNEGELVSFLDPPAELQAAAHECHNIGVWPVLAGDPNRRDTLLASPIILYDFPQIAPESAGNFCDSTEMDEMLALRVLTLTEEEKQEMRQGDKQARQMLERTENMPEEHLRRLHGAVRGLRRLSNEAK